MTRFIFLIPLALLIGCRTPTRTATPAADFASPAGLKQYLENQNLPAVKSVETWPNEYAPGLTINTTHYTIHTTLLEPLMLRQVPGFVESAYRAYQRQLPRPIDTDTPFKLYLFGDRANWEAFTRDFTGPLADMYLKIRKGAYYLNGACVTYNIGREKTFSVLGHEGWHQFNHRHFRYRLPSWVDEGIATHFENSTYHKGWFYFQPERNIARLAALKRTILDDNTIPVRRLIALNPGEVLATEDTAQTAAFYAQSYALVRFLREEDYGRRLALFHSLLLDGLKGTWPLTDREKQIAANRNIPLTTAWNRQVSRKLFEAYITNDFENIEKEYSAFCRKLVYRVRLK